MPRADALPLIVAAAVTLAAAATDLWRFKVYNALTLPALVGGVAASFWMGGAAGLGQSLLGAAAGFATLAAFFALGGVGAGDVKLFAALGAWLGPWPVLQVFAASALAAGAYAVALSVWSKGLGEASVEVALLAQRMMWPGRWPKAESTIGDEVTRPDRRRRLVPFAATTCLGFFAMLAIWHDDRGGAPRPPAASVASRGIDR